MTVYSRTPIQNVNNREGGREGSGFGKTNAPINLINNKPDIDKIYLCAKDPYEPTCQFLINKRESTELKHFNNPKAFIEYSNDMPDVYKKIDECN